MYPYHELEPIVGAVPRRNCVSCNRTRFIIGRNKYLGYVCSNCTSFWPTAKSLADAEPTLLRDPIFLTDILASALNGFTKPRRMCYGSDFDLVEELAHQVRSVIIDEIKRKMHTAPSIEQWFRQRLRTDEDRIHYFHKTTDNRVRTSVDRLRREHDRTYYDYDENEIVDPADTANDMAHHEEVVETYECLVEYLSQYLSHSQIQKLNDLLNCLKTHPEFSFNQVCDVVGRERNRSRTNAYQFIKTLLNKLPPPLGKRFADMLMIIRDLRR